MRFSTRIPLCVLLLVFSTVANAQRASGCPNRTVVVNVLDRDGNVMAGFGPTAFRAEYLGQPLKVQVGAATSAPRRVVILVDLSGSTRQSSALARLLAGNLAVSAEAKNLRPALVLFSDRIIDTVDFSHSFEDVVRRLAKLPDAWGRTAMLDALKYAMTLFGQPVPGDSVYLVSDGGENSSRVLQADVERAFVANGIRVYSFGIAGAEPFQNVEEHHGQTLLADLAERTGGEVLSLNVEPSEANRARLKSSLQRLYQQMTDFYELQLELPTEPMRKPQRWNLEVVDAQGKKRKDVRVIYPHELAPCATTVDAAGAK